MINSQPGNTRHKKYTSPVVPKHPLIPFGSALALCPSRALVRKASGCLCSWLVLDDRNRTGTASARDPQGELPAGFPDGPCWSLPSALTPLSRKMSRFKLPPSRLAGWQGVMRQLFLISADPNYNPSLATGQIKFYFYQNTPTSHLCMVHWPSPKLSKQRCYEDNASKQKMLF